MRRAPSAAAAETPRDHPRLIVLHGDADATVHSSNAAQVLARAAGGGAGTERARVDRTDGRSAQRTLVRGADGAVQAELWLIEGAGHAWSGGSPTGTYTDPSGPDASAEMVRFFLQA
jgi:poly(3-hydroxybutyrate) depolymerase